MTLTCVHSGDTECTPRNLSNIGRSAAADPASTIINTLATHSIARSGRTPLMDPLFDRIAINDNQA
ncbi:hypothetical protein [Microbispora sp. NPDC046933]|uniref:hypothetical protein n=1 Tax=Microbispora sp. NPDC046933 TaxID=3155618 RepID=UPI0033FC4A62